MQMVLNEEWEQFDRLVENMDSPTDSIVALHVFCAYVSRGDLDKADKLLQNMRGGKIFSCIEDFAKAWEWEITSKRKFPDHNLNEAIDYLLLRLRDNNYKPPCPWA